ncbi:entericidin EcnA/B family protein [Haloferula sp.]|uniref:entericidin EcnA/B family protein n=1 Tax=Haloferula sp. TaxID=2497595 RepID=UPI00329B3300
MKKIAFGILAVFALGSCNTTIGLGRDLRQLGTGMENKAHGKKFDGSERGSDESEENLPTY